MTRIRGFNHVVLCTNDMDKTIRFYRDLLGLKIKAASGVPAAAMGGRFGPWKRLYFFELGDGSTLAFAEFPSLDTASEASFFDSIWPEGEGLKVTRAQKMDHIALNVDRKADLEHYRDVLRAAGYTVTDIVELETSPFVMSIYLYDPNGIPLEIATWDKDDTRWPEREGKWLNDPEPASAMAD